MAPPQFSKLKSPIQSSHLYQQPMARLAGRLSSSPNALKRLLQGNATQRLSRFLEVRRSYSFFQNIRQRFNSSFHRACLNPASQSLFVDQDVDTRVQEIRQTGVTFGVNLPDAMVAEILDYATEAPCSEPGYDALFKVSDLCGNCLPDHHQVIRALVNDVENCQPIEAIARDPFLLQVVRNYLHYWPTRVTKHLVWSIASDLPETEVQQHYPPTNFHYDIAGYNFMTAYFYITPVLDEKSGPHVMIRGSHRRKPLSLLLSSGRHADETIYQYYSPKQEISIQGQAGFGFIQDPSCFHKVKAPTRCNRLLLQIRYS